MSEIPSQDTLAFIKLFNLPANEEVIPWVGTVNVGLSVRKEYPEDGNFIPTKNRDGKNDDIAVIRVGYLIKNVKNDKAFLLVDIFKGSRYLADNRFDYNFDDSLSPTKESLEISKLSVQPSNLENYKQYEFDIVTKKFFDIEKKQNIEPVSIINKIYAEHLKTTASLFFRFKIYIQTNGFQFAEPIIKFLNAINFYLFGKTLIENERYSLKGILDLYDYSQLRTLKPQRINIFGSDIVTSDETLLTYAAFILIIFLLRFYTHLNLFKIFTFVGHYYSSTIFQFAFVIFGLWFFDKVIPYLILFTVNRVLWVRIKVANWKVHI